MHLIVLTRRPYILSRLAVYFCDVLGIFNAIQGTAAHLKAAVEWICRAQDATPDDGVSACYTFGRGWHASYPETTGYIIPTLWDYLTWQGHDKPLRERIFRMARWLLSVQMPNGAFQAGQVDCPPVPKVFNTGQVIFGLVRMYQESQEEVYLKAAKRAGDFLIEVQDDDGAWRRYAYYDVAHTYYSRCGNALLVLAHATGDTRYRDAGQKNIEWVLSCREPNGWFAHMEFAPGTLPPTHTIGYTLDGVIESGILEKEARWTEAVAPALEALRRSFESKGYLGATFLEDWTPSDNFRCITGDAQVALLWFRWYELTGDEKFFQAGCAMNQALKATQNLGSRHPGIRGGLKGNHPIYEEWDSFSYLNWAAKFFIDSLLAQEKLTRKDSP